MFESPCHFVSLLFFHESNYVETTTKTYSEHETNDMFFFNSQQSLGIQQGQVISSIVIEC